jgi:hypothetical protein
MDWHAFYSVLKVDSDIVAILAATSLLDEKANVEEVFATESSDWQWLQTNWNPIIADVNYGITQTIADIWNAYKDAANIGNDTVIFYFKSDGTIDNI